MSLPAQPSNGQRHIGTVLGVPVALSPWYLLLVWIVAARSATWQLGLVSLFVVTSSVLIHELGHALPARRAGLRPRIVLHAFGGWCEHPPPRHRHEDLRLTAGGPLAGFLLAALAAGLAEVTPVDTPWYIRAVLMGWVEFNLFFSVLNLLPIPPLDGGRLLQIGLGYKRPQEQADRLSWQVGRITAALGLCLAITWGDLFLAALAGVLGYQNHQQIRQGYARPMFAVPQSSPRRTTKPLPNWRETPIVVGLTAVLSLLWLLGSFLPVDYVDPVFQYGALSPRAIQDGELWRWLTYSWLHSPGRWQALLFGLAFLWLFGQPLEHDTSKTRLMQLVIVGTTLAGVFATIFASLSQARFGGAAFGSSALAWVLFTSWALRAPRAPLTLLGWTAPLTPRQALALAFGADSFTVWLGSTPWAWHLHAGGLCSGALLTMGWWDPRVAWRALIDTYRLANPPQVDLRGRDHRDGNRPPS